VLISDVEKRSSLIWVAVTGGIAVLIPSAAISMAVHLARAFLVDAELTRDVLGSVGMDDPR
jgi:hypothetical protein